MEQCLKIVANLEDLEMKESNMAILAEHLDKHAHGRMKSTMELMEENIPKIYRSVNSQFHFKKCWTTSPSN